MTRIEQRKLARYPLQKQPDAQLVLRVGTVRHNIGEIRDISDHGISFRLDKGVDPASQVAIEYADPTIQVEVYGQVAWCSRIPEVQPPLPSVPEFILGIELLSPMTLYAVLQKR